MSAGTEEQLASRLKSSFACSLQTDESTEMSGLSILLICRGRFIVYMCSAEILPFSKTHQVEAGFSRYVLTKSKYRYILDIATDMTIQLSTITPNLQDLLRRINYTILHTSSLWGETIYSNSDTWLVHQPMHTHKIVYIKTFKIAPTCFDHAIIIRELRCSLLKLHY